jgi:hypothetical protein
LFPGLFLLKQQVSLAKAVDMLEFGFDGAPHTALPDARNTARVHAAIIRRMKREPDPQPVPACEPEPQASTSQFWRTTASGTGERIAAFTSGYPSADLALGLSRRKPPKFPNIGATCRSSSVEKHRRCRGMRLSGLPLSTRREKVRFPARLRTKRRDEKSVREILQPNTPSALEKLASRNVYLKRTELIDHSVICPHTLPPKGIEGSRPSPHLKARPILNSYT